VVPAATLMEMDKLLETARFNMAAVTFDKVSFAEAARQLAEVKGNLPRAWKDFKAQKAGRASAEEQRLIAAVDQRMDTLEPVYTYLQTAYASANKISTRSVLDDDWPEVEKNVLAPVLQLVKLQEHNVEATYTRASQEGARMRRLVLGTLIIGAMAGLAATVMSVLLARSMTLGIRTLGNALERAAAGELDVRVDFHHQNELGETARHFEATLARLRETVAGVMDNAATLASEAEQLARIAARVEARSNSQSDAAEATAAAVEEMLTSIEQVAGNARDSLGTSENAARLCDEGKQVADEAATEMAGIAASVKQAAGLVAALDQRAQEIGQVTRLIKEVAGNTNLLALNAAIEAARAGEQGRGFAVVADEVRRLAERTEQATSEIEPMIAVIQADTRRAADAMESGGARVGQGVQLVGRTSASLATISQGAGKTAASVGEIASATREQTAASRDIAGNVEKIVAMAEENRAATGGLTAAVERLMALSRQQQEAMARFRV
jgi:methyl-accepting chemotaxis protein